MSSSFSSELNLAFIPLLHPSCQTTEAAPIYILSHKTVFLKTPFVKMEIYSSASVTHWTSLDVCVLGVPSCCLGPLPNLLRTFVPPSWEMTVIIAQLLPLSFPSLSLQQRLTSPEP